MAIGLFIIPFVLLVGIAGILVFYFVRRRRATAQATDPVCGHCAYIVRGLPTFTCPECGSDLRTVGIVTPSQRRPLGRGARAVIWTLILPVPAMVISVLAMAFVLPWLTTNDETMTLGGPTSQAYSQLVLRAEGRRLGWPWQGRARSQAPLQRLSLTLVRPEGFAAPLGINLQTMGYHSQQPSGAIVEQSSGFDAAALRNWMTDAGVDTNNPQVQAEIQAIFAVVQSASTAGLTTPPGNLFQQPLRSAGSSTMPPNWEIAAILAFWFVIWVIGLWLVVLRRRPAASPQPE